MRERLIEEAPLGEARGGYSEELHEEFTRAGFYRALQPRRYGGYEFGLDTFIKLITEISHGDAATGWSLCLARTTLARRLLVLPARPGRALRARRQLRAPARRRPGRRRRSTAATVQGRGLLLGRHALHALHRDAVGPSPHDPGAPPMPLACVIPSGEYTILDDWGGGQQLGLQGTRIELVSRDGRVVPTHLVEPYEWKNFAMPAEGTPGYAAPQPAVPGSSTTIYYGGLGAPMVGAAKAALDEYEKIIRARPTLLPPKTMRYKSPDYQRWFGEAWVLMNSAEACRRVGDAVHGRRAALGAGRAVHRRRRLAHPRIAMHAGKIAFDAIDILFRTSGSSATRRGSRRAAATATARSTRPTSAPSTTCTTWRTPRCTSGCRRRSRGGAGGGGVGDTHPRPPSMSSPSPARSATRRHERGSATPLRRRQRRLGHGRPRGLGRADAADQDGRGDRAHDGQRRRRPAARRACRRRIGRRAAAERRAARDERAERRRRRPRSRPGGTCR